MTPRVTRTLIVALSVGLLLSPAASRAQQPAALPENGFSLRPFVGVLVPRSPLVWVNDGQNPSILLTSSPSIGADLDMRRDPVSGDYRFDVSSAPGEAGTLDVSISPGGMTRGD